MEHLCACGCGERVKWNKQYKRWNRFINCHYSRVRSPETRQKLSDNARNISDETRRKRSESRKGIKHTEETKAKMAKIAIGRKCSAETKKKMSIAHRNISEETRRKLSEASQNQSKERRLKNAIAHMKPRTDGYCDIWSDKEYKNDLRRSVCGGCGMSVYLSLKVYDWVLSNHHIDGDKMNCHPSNFKTLCCRCHRLADIELAKTSYKTM